MNQSLPGPIWAAADPAAGTWAEILSASPLILHVLTSTGFPLGAASVVGPILKNVPSHFLVMPAWSLELPDASEMLVRTAAAYLSQHPLHKISFVCNTHRERKLMSTGDCPAIVANNNCLIDDSLFNPVPGIEPVYDAVYNARLSPDKRPELARNIEKLALIYFYNSYDGSPADFHKEHARLQSILKTATFVNKLNPDGCERLSAPEVNKILAQSRVGLCLSSVEGCMRASIEYLFAGLSVVSTPSLGGRDYFFDDEFCIIADPDPRSIREAVDALVARKVPPDYVRAKTIAKVELERRRYIDFVQSIIDEAGGTGQFEHHFWQLTRSSHTIMHWRLMKEFSETVARLVTPGS